MELRFLVVEGNTRESREAHRGAFGATPSASYVGVLTALAPGAICDIVYPADGTFEDYAFWQHGVWSMLWEMGYSHSPNPEQVREMVRTNVPGLRRMYEGAPIARAERHAFTGKCDRSLRKLDLQIE